MGSAYSPSIWCLEHILGIYREVFGFQTLGAETQKIDTRKHGWEGVLVMLTHIYPQKHTGCSVRNTQKYTHTYTLTPTNTPTQPNTPPQAFILMCIVPIHPKHTLASRRLGMLVAASLVVFCGPQ